MFRNRKFELYFCEWSSRWSVWKSIYKPTEKRIYSVEKIHLQSLFVSVYTFKSENEFFD